MTMRSRR